MVIELHYHIRLPSHLSHPLGVQFAHFPVFLDLKFSFVLFPLVVASALLMWYEQFFAARQLFPLPQRPEVKVNGAERYLVSHSNDHRWLPRATHKCKFFWSLDINVISKVSENRPSEHTVLLSVQHVLFF